jgi:hypothetical protein
VAKILQGVKVVVVSAFEQADRADALKTLRDKQAAIKRKAAKKEGKANCSSRAKG